LAKPIHFLRPADLDLPAYKSLGVAAISGWHGDELEAAIITARNALGGIMDAGVIITGTMARPASREEWGRTTETQEVEVTTRGSSSPPPSTSTTPKSTCAPPER
jgi:hypothetical protein